MKSPLFGQRRYSSIFFVVSPFLFPALVLSAMRPRSPMVRSALGKLHSGAKHDCQGLVSRRHKVTPASHGGLARPSRPR